MARRHASSLWGTAEGAAGLGDSVFVGTVGVLLGRHGDAVVSPQPASQVDQAAARAAKRPLGPVLPVLPGHPAFTDWAAYLNHRILTFQTWEFFRQTYRPLRFWFPRPSSQQ